jgi:hypothetical protein
MEQSPFWESNNLAAFVEPKGSLPCFQKPAIVSLLSGGSYLFLILAVKPVKIVQ